MAADGLCECGCGLPTTIASRNDPRYGVIQGQPRRFRKGHYGRTVPTLPKEPRRLCECGCGQFAGLKKRRAQRFIRGHNGTIRSISAADYAIEDRGYQTACWIWRGEQTEGRGRVTINGRKMRPYRAMYEQEVGAIPPGVVLHHVCGEPACIRVSHMLLMSQGDHMRLHAEIRRQH